MVIKHAWDCIESNCKAFIYPKMTFHTYYNVDTDISQLHLCLVGSI